MTSWFSKCTYLKPPGTETPPKSDKFTRPLVGAAITILAGGATIYCIKTIG
jgi:hypothetical protein